MPARKNAARSNRPARAPQTPAPRGYRAACGIRLSRSVMHLGRHVMCNRISQYRPPLRYAEALGLANPFMLFDAADRRPGYNLAPGMHPLAIYPDETLRAIHWGYRPPWAVEENLPQTINARAETAATARYFRTLWRTGRVLVPADGWFEWRGKPAVTEATAAPPRKGAAGGR